MLGRTLIRVLLCFQLFVWLAWGDNALAVDLLISDFTGTDPALNTPWTPTTFLRPDTEYSGWQFGPGSFAVAGVDDRLGFHVVWQSAEESTLADAIANEQYLHLTVTPINQTQIDFSGFQVSFSVQRASFHAPRQYAVFSSVGGFGEEQNLFQTARIDSSDTSQHDYSFFFPLSGYDGISGPVEFRLYSFAANYNHDTSLSAFGVTEFSGDVYALTVTATSGGTALATPDTTLFAGGTAASIAATPESGFHFEGWSGAVSGFGNPVSITMDSDKSLTANFALNVPQSMAVGTNIDQISDYATHWVFVDLFKRSRDWLTRNADQTGDWDTGLADTIPRDVQGYATQVPFDPATGDPAQMVHSILFNPAIFGTYRFRYEGQGTLEIRWAEDRQTLTTTTNGPHVFEFITNLPDNPITLEISATGPADYLTNFRLFLPGFHDQPDSHPFHPLFMERLEPFTNIRFMDWGQTNNSPLTAWSDRTTPASNTQAKGNGVALEYMVALANTTDKDIWICIPHAADDTYIREAAMFLRDQLNPALKIYIEYSNETWNSLFSQTTYVQDQGEALALSSNRWEAGQRFAALRSIQMWDIFEQEFVDDSRLEKVLATQSAGSSTTDMRVAMINDPDFNPNRVMPNALAIAPYFGFYYSQSYIDTFGYPTMDDILDTVAPNEISAVRSDVQSQKQVADTQGWDLISYEGGQHFLGVYDAQLTQILSDANRDPRMGQRYQEYLDMLQEEGMTFFSHFTLVRNFTGSGSWGALEYMDQPLEEAHKYRQIVDWIAANGAQAVPGLGRLGLMVVLFAFIGLARLRIR